MTQKNSPKSKIQSFLFRFGQISASCPQSAAPNSPATVKSPRLTSVSSHYCITGWYPDDNTYYSLLIFPAGSIQHNPNTRLAPLLPQAAGFMAFMAASLSGSLCTSFLLDIGALEEKRRGGFNKKTEEFISLISKAVVIGSAPKHHNAPTQVRKFSVQSKYLIPRENFSPILLLILYK